jgi:hypothetical protein
MRRPVALQPSPEARLAAVIVNAIDDLRDGRFGGRPQEADFADYRDALRPYLAREILIACIGEAKTCGRPDRVADLELQLSQIVLKN